MHEEKLRRNAEDGERQVEGPREKTLKERLAHPRRQIKVLSAMMHLKYIKVLTRRNSEHFGALEQTSDQVGERSTLYSLSPIFSKNLLVIVHRTSTKKR